MDTIKNLVQRLDKNNIGAFFLSDKDAAVKKALALISKNDKIAYGGSVTLDQIGLKTYLKEKGYDVIDAWEKGISREESLKRRRVGLHSDVFITGTNAITLAGELVNVDGLGNRISGMIYGPKKVIIICGKNKIVDDYPEAIKRIREIAAPLNTKRLDKNTPCKMTGRCMDCSSDDRICNMTLTIHRMGTPGRMFVLIVDKDLGY